MKFNGKQVHTLNSFDYKTAKPGIYVNQDVVEEAVGVVPPDCICNQCAQSGEPAAYKIDTFTARPVYETFKKVGGKWPECIWEYCGKCFFCENVERGYCIPVVE